MANYQNNMRYSRNGCGSSPNYSMNIPQPRNGNCSGNCVRNECIKKDEIECTEKKKDPMEHFPLAMAYVKCQKWRKLYDETKGFQRGTMFEELDKSFLGRGGCNR